MKLTLLVRLGKYSEEVPPSLDDFFTCVEKAFITYFHNQENIFSSATDKVNRKANLAFTLEWISKNLLMELCFYDFNWYSKRRIPVELSAWVYAWLIVLCSQFRD